MVNKRIGKTDTIVPAIGQGTMGVGGFFKSDFTQDRFFVEMLKLGINSGMTFIDTAEAYGEGHSEELVGQAVKGIRDEVFIASKVSPENLAYDDVIDSAEKSLRRMKTDRIDLYQVHWPNPLIPFEETFRAMNKLLADGKIRYVGVCNFSLKDLAELNALVSKDDVVAIQVEYNLFDRSIEDDILPYCEDMELSVIAYSPLDQGGICYSSKMEVLRHIAEKYDKSPFQIALNWLVSKPTVIPIPKAVNANHIIENAVAADFSISEEDLNLIDSSFDCKVINIPVDNILVNSEGVEKFIPSAEVLSKSISEGNILKPIRVVKNEANSDEYEYKLVEGKVRYWAWVFAHNGNFPIKAIER